MTPVTVPATLAAAVADVHGAAGRTWLAGLPDAVTRCADRWGLTLGEPYPASYHWVAPAVRDDGSAVVLKLGLSGDLGAEAAALAAWDGQGAVRLLAGQDDDGTDALLLQAARPGTDLCALPDEEALPVLAAVARRLHAGGAARPAGVRDSADRVALLRAGSPLVPPGLTGRAADVLERLLATAAPAVLCHGDLHHANVLRDGAGWLAIDPHGVWGEPALDAGTALHNPPRAWATVPDLPRLVHRRVALLADGLGVPAARVRAWGLVSAAVGLVWTAQDHGRTDDDVLALALVLAGG
ncbi:aminoglycoside phosphotransferase family protein [Geodermatophilus sp. DSM 44513]|uniref:aminoglycoside phosphotransferase family protein n=1 Tax=Geodermatophilus sp. DSM 44513 TaxID=1528104 RepID=UPI001281FEA0|nr:aminoglycoside phosphotransferase family protein [Geodermatophilus sp. DSM 44513]WNV76580.1 aminoglycoside phosphotransferase family protein [Geodermatophilus sp. DSM 44513]